MLDFDALNLNIQSTGDDVPVAVLEENNNITDIFMDYMESLDENVVFVNEKSIVRLDKAAKFNKAVALQVELIAREKGDKLYKKLVTVRKTAKVILGRLTKKYGREAEKRAKIMIKERNSKKRKRK